MTRSGDEKKQLLKDLVTGVAEASSSIDDHKSLKAKICSLSDQFLQDDVKKTGSGSVMTNGEQLKAMDEKIIAMEATISRRKAAHSKEMKRLKNEHDLLEKVSHLGLIGIISQ